MELGIAYYGNVFPDRARADLIEMAAHGCNSILIVMSEYDWKIWRKNIFEIARIAKEEFKFTVYINLWAWGGVFGGEACSFFLHNNVDNRQIVSNNENNSLMNIKVPAACFNTQEFKRYVFNTIKVISKSEFFDGFFWDEPHYFYIPKSANRFTCRCDTCQTIFKKLYKKEMPIYLTDEVVEFKEKMIINFIKEISQKVKEIDPKKKNIVCLVPPPLETGISDWDNFCASLKDVIDVFSSDPYWLLFGKSLKYVKKYTEKTIEIAKKYKLKSQLWCLGFLVPKNKESELQEAIKIFVECKTDSIFTWCYRGAEGMSLSCGNPRKAWKVIGDAYNSILLRE